MKRIIMVLMLVLAGCGKSPETEISSGQNSNASEKQSQILQIGETWSRYYVAKDQLGKTNSKIANTVQGIAQVKTRWNKATAFYLGKFDGQYLMATNNHVFENVFSCYFKQYAPIVKFPYLNKQFFCSRLIGAWKSVDFTIFALAVPEADKKYMDSLTPLRFNFNSRIRQEQELMTAGFGSHRNPTETAMFGEDDECKVFSPFQSFKRLNNPTSDQEFMKTAHIWSFAHGCDLSSGDSGSPIIDKDTGRVIGINWAIGEPKPLDVISPSYLQRLIDEKHENVWSILNYAVPASVIKRTLKKWIATGRGFKTNKLLIQELLIRSN